MKEEGIEIHCPRCDHDWTYTGDAWWITCPKCRKLIKNPEKFKEVRQRVER